MTHAPGESNKHARYWKGLPPVLHSYAPSRPEGYWKAQLNECRAFDTPDPLPHSPDHRTPTAICLPHIWTKVSSTQEPPGSQELWALRILLALRWSSAPRIWLITSLQNSEANAGDDPCASRPTPLAIDQSAAPFCLSLLPLQALRLWSQRSATHLCLEHLLRFRFFGSCPLQVAAS